MKIIELETRFISDEIKDEQDEVMAWALSNPMLRIAAENTPENLCAIKLNGHWFISLPEHAVFDPEVESMLERRLNKQWDEMK